MVSTSDHVLSFCFSIITELVQYVQCTSKNPDLMYKIAYPSMFSVHCCMYYSIMKPTKLCLNAKWLVKCLDISLLCRDCDYIITKPCIYAVH